MPLDQYIRLDLACQDATSYPTNGIRTRLFPHTLQAYKDRLAKRSNDLFTSDAEYPIDFLEAYDGEAFQPWTAKTTTHLNQHLWDNRKDPRCRHVFIQADTSFSPLDCSKDVFLVLLTFHQVMPQFLHLIFSFGRQIAPVSDFHYTAFHHDNFLDSQGADEDYEILRLGRSGRQIRHCYNLWSVERSDADKSWSFRQTAVYHSFDVENGRAFWINVKANELMLERITDVETMPGNREAGTKLDNCSVFGSTLTTHLVIFEWCCENWREFLADLEREIREILAKVKNAPLAEVEKKLALNFEALMAPPPSSASPPRRGTTLSRMGTVSRRSTGTGFTPAPKRVLSGLTTTSVASQSPPGGQPSILGGSSLAVLAEQAPLEQFRVFDEFSVKSLQRLSGIGSKLQEAALIMRLDAEVITGITTHYDSLIRSESFPDSLKTGCEGNIAAFKEQADGYTRSLESEQARIITLLKILEDGKSLFDTVLQFRNMETNKLFAVNAQESAARMEAMTVNMHESTLRMETMTSDMGRIAEKTERETSSMHVITLVTLVFLPGTFVATLFGSGLFQWDQNDPQMRFPLWKPDYFNLFLEICLPMMFGVVLVWYLIFLYSKRREKQKKARRDEEAQIPTEDEKARD